MDLNKAGLLVGVLALILAVPLAILANLGTPLVRNWYVGRSQAEIKKRLGKLQKDLLLAKDEWTFTGAERARHWESYWLTTMIFLSFYCVFGFFEFALLLFKPVIQQLLIQSSFSRHAYWILLVFPFVGAAFDIWVWRDSVAAHDRNTTIHTQYGRDKLEQQIRDLTAKLDQQG